MGDLRAIRIEKCLELVPLLERLEANKLNNIVTGDGSSFTPEYQHSANWGVAREEVPERVRQQINTKDLC
jgi:hypothetical protein